MELISREMAIDHIRVLGGEDRERLMGILNNKEILPTIESRPQGEWRTSRVHGGIVKCDFCGFQWGSNEGRKFNFCPKCGADMRGEK